MLGELWLRRCNKSKIPSAAGKFPVFLTSTGIILTLQRTEKTYGKAMSSNAAQLRSADLVSYCQSHIAFG